MSNIYFIPLLVSILFLKIFKNVKTSEGVYLWETWYRVSTFKCLKEKYSKEFVIVNANYYNVGKVDPDAEINILNARAAGFENVDIYFSPCIKPSSTDKLCGNGSALITSVLDYLNNIKVKFGRVWLYIVFGPNECQTLVEWDKANKTSNIEFIEDVVNALRKRKQDFGFMTNKYHWHEITGNTRKYNDTPLLYFHIDGKNNFEDYDEYGYPFGGWEKPTMKGYENEKVCGIYFGNIKKI